MVLRRRSPIVIRREPVLGTVLTLTLRGVGGRAASEIETAVVAEIERLEQSFSAYRDDSELRRWGRGEVANPSDDLRELLRLGLYWQHLTNGVFNPAVNAISDRWKQAAIDGVVPGHDELAALATSIRQPRYDGVTRIGDCSHLTFNALAKGLVVDRAGERAMHQLGGGSVTVEIGGDLVHRGDESIRVAVENPLRPYDNEPPLCVVEIDNSAIATSGSARRGFRVGDRWFSHVIDPRSGWPVDHIASASAISPTAATADAAATMLSVEQPSEGLGWAERQDGEVATLVMTSRGEQFISADWHGLVRA
jgi:FAD:protein FMN transferase